jgi:hypothetical protein
VRTVRSQTLAYRAGPITSRASTASYPVTDRPLGRLFAVTQQPMSRVVTQDLVLQCLDPWGRSLDLPASFGYDPADPWAVWITFRGPTGGVRWFVARELLLRGITDPVGEGDVQLWPSIDDDGRAAVAMELCSPGGRLVTLLLTNELYRFLTRTLAVVPLGTESIDLDRLVAAITGRSQSE